MDWRWSEPGLHVDSTWSPQKCVAQCNYLKFTWSNLKVSSKKEKKEKFVDIYNPYMV
jgi:hypothetical protein